MSRNNGERSNAVVTHRVLWIYGLSCKCTYIYNRNIYIMVYIFWKIFDPGIDKRFSHVFWQNLILWFILWKHFFSPKSIKFWTNLSALLEFKNPCLSTNTPIWMITDEKYVRIKNFLVWKFNSLCFFLNSSFVTSFNKRGKFCIRILFEKKIFQNIKIH